MTPTPMTSLSTRTARIVAILAVVAGISGCAGASTDGDRANTTAARSTASGRALVAPDADTFEVDGGTATLACEGYGPMPVILLSGPEESVDRWDAVVDDLGQAVLACRFSPPTGPGAGPATPISQADALSETLDASQLPGPYLVVGESVGGLTVRRFGQRHRDQLGAAVLLDPTDPTALPSLHSELTAAGWDAEATEADADVPASWPDVSVTIFARGPGGAAPDGSPGTSPPETDGQEAYTTLTANARIEPVEGARDDVDLGATRRVTNEIIRLVDQAS